MIKNGLLLFIGSACSFACIDACCEDEQSRFAEVVYVEATRQSEKSQTVPISVSSLGSHVLDSGVVMNTVDIGQAIPALTTTSYTSVEPQYFIRGVGSTASSAGEDHSVVVFSDDAYVGRSGSTALDFLDLERVEVLKGPQGTLFGRNAAGGVIQLIPQKPSEDREGYVSARFGNLNQQHYQLALSGPILKGDTSDTTARIAASYSRRDGDVSNLTTGSDRLRQKEAHAIRAQLRHQINDEISVRLVSEFAKRDDIGVAPRKSSSPNSLLLAGGFIPVPQPTSDINEVTLSIDGHSDQDLWAGAVHFDIDLGFADFRSVSSIRNNEYSVGEDVSGVGLIVLETREDTELLTQEFRLHSKTSSKLKWTLGAFLLHEDIDRVNVNDLSAISDLANLNPVLVGLPPGFVVPPELASYAQDAKNDSAAVYGELEYPFTETMSLLFGLRQSYDRKQLSVDAGGNDLLGFGLLDAGPYSGAVDKSFSDTSGKLGLVYRNQQGLTSYLHLSSAYKAGGFDGNASSLASFQNGFEPEQSAMIEWGVKADLLDGRLNVNWALFAIEYSDLQVFQVANNGTSFTSNAAEAEIRGLEFELRARLNSSFQATAACTFLDTEYTQFISDVDDDGDTLPDDLAGNSLTRAPDYSCASSLQWAPKLNGQQPLNIDLSYAYQDDVFITPQNRELDTIEAYGLANLSINYAFSSKFSTGLTVRNLTDKDYKLHTFDADPLIRGNLESSVYALGRLWVGSMRYEF